MVFGSLVGMAGCHQVVICSRPYHLVCDLQRECQLMELLFFVDGIGLHVLFSPNRV